ncbi:MAG TPA: succinate dehydrogenase, hydrophobic membrane anchor protein [Steroidobacteraceae bacterium]|jgi:succinate dehydrogenase / fumarate reductase membrane anchor subunit
MSLRSPVARVLGLGSAKEGSSHWWSQRVSAVALAILGLWFVVALLTLPDFSHDTVVDWMAAPLNAVLLMLLVGTLAYHSLLGVQVVVEDYVHHGGLKVATIVLLTFVHFALAAAAIFAVLRVAFGGPIAGSAA